MDPLEALVKAARASVDDRVWTAAVKLAREGAVAGVSDDGDEIHLRVKARGKPIPAEVFLWPNEKDSGCDCDLPQPCVHVCAAALATLQARTGVPALPPQAPPEPTQAVLPGIPAPAPGRAPAPPPGPAPGTAPARRMASGAPIVAPAGLPQPKKQFAVRLRYALQTDDNAISVSRVVVHPDGRTEPLRGLLADSQVFAERADAQAEALLAVQPNGPLSAEAIRRLLVLLAPNADATLDGEKIRLSAEPLMFRIRVTDEGDGFKVGLYRPAGIDRLVRGAAVADGALRPTSHGDLTPEQRRLLVRGVTFAPDEVGRLVGDYLPKLRDRIPVEVITQRLPDSRGLRPQVLLSLAEVPEGLEVRADLVYGVEPVIARVEGGVLKALGSVVPARDLSAERAAMRRFEDEMGLPVGYRQTLPPDRAAAFLRDKVYRHDGPKHGFVTEHRFRVAESPVQPRIEVRPVEGGGFSLDVEFMGGAGRAEPRAVLAAWASGRTLVPLLEGGYAPLPSDWLREHGGLLRELLEARDATGKVDRNATAALVELVEDTEGDVPPDLDHLRRFLEGEVHFPDVVIPKDFVGELRHYQEAGYRWLRFLRDVGLNGVLADDMGLGKTIQAIAAMLDAGGQHLVVAPTSVLRNWEREIQRFAPKLKVNLYHGSGRRLDGADVTLTSYALLRMDVEQLREREWMYCVLDEAQAIKNPDSQTARCARRLRAKHRLAMSGTPVENRLEELWSLFRFLMPGFLGSIEAFRERFARPIEGGDPRARDALRRRVRPYVLRRLKGQVAQELPPLTDLVMRCEMGPEQRKVYDAVRLAAREDVQRAIAERGVMGATMQVLEALLRMRQACCDPTLLPGDVGAGAGSAKLDRLDELLVEMMCDDHKALIFSQWTSLLDRVEQRLVALGIPWVRLDGSTRDRQPIIDRFQSPDGPPVFLLSLKAGGTGLNLTAADYVVHLDPWWNPAVQQQATDRAHRIGQDKPVVSYKLIAESTVEERILELQEAKKALADAAIGSEGGFLRTLSAEEIRGLFEGP